MRKRLHQTLANLCCFMYFHVGWNIKGPLKSSFKSLCWYFVHLVLFCSFSSVAVASDSLRTVDCQLMIEELLVKIPAPTVCTLGTEPLFARRQPPGWCEIACVNEWMKGQCEALWGGWKCCISAGNVLFTLHVALLVPFRISQGSVHGGGCSHSCFLALCFISGLPPCVTLVEPRYYCDLFF